MEAAKRKTFWLIWIASAILLSLSALASSVDVYHLKTRAELSAKNGQFSVEPLALNPANATRYYDWLEEVASDSPVAPKGAARQLRLPKTDATLSGTNTLGYTTANGEVFLQPGMSRVLQAHTLRHEGVHSFLSVADNAPLAGLRQNAGVGAYSNSAFFNAAEEILAEGIASGSLRQGWRHAFNGEYVVRQGTRFQQTVTRTAFFTELGVGATGLGLFGYGAYELGNYWFGSGE